MRGQLFRVTAVTYDERETISTVTAVAAGDCLDIIREVIPRARITESSPVKITMLLADLLELHREAGLVCDDDDPRFAGCHVIYASLHKIVGGLGAGRS